MPTGLKLGKEAQAKVLKKAMFSLEGNLVTFYSLMRQKQHRISKDF
jgi:hypothetical protein